MTLVRAELDASLAARVVKRVPLLYSGGADAVQDRPAHVRAGSGIAAWAGGYAVVQDDSSFVAWIQPGAATTVSAIALPAGEGGLRQFDDVRGNKRHKLDLEACFAFERGGVDTLVALGSGSTPARERLVALTHALGRVTVHVRHAPELYSALRADRAFSGSELNIEGAVLVGDRVRLFQRGNGAAVAGVLPVDATVDVPWAVFEACLGKGLRVPVQLENVARYALGEVAGVRLTFTDATPGPGASVVYLAAAEASPDTYRDGQVCGAAVGLLHDAAARYTLLTDALGEPLTDKAEGIALDPLDPTRALVVLDADDPARPSELCEVVLTGFG